MSTAAGQYLLTIINDWRTKLRCLEAWTITVDTESDYTCQIHIDAKTQTATFFLCPDQDVDDVQYVIHELLHVAIRDLRSVPEAHHLKHRAREEQLVQDLEALIFGARYGADHCGEG